VPRSAEQMTTLQAELEGSENRINVARMRFNEAATEFNASIHRLPAILVASLGGLLARFPTPPH
jgi:LemA protein